MANVALFHLLRSGRPYTVVLLCDTHNNYVVCQNYIRFFFFLSAKSATKLCFVLFFLRLLFVCTLDSPFLRLFVDLLYAATLLVT